MCFRKFDLTENSVAFLFSRNHRGEVCLFPHEKDSGECIYALF